MSDHHITSYKSHTIVWVFLMIMTGLSVAAKYMDFHSFAVLVALVIATIKGIAVIMYFMHVKHESKFLQWIIIITFVVFGSILMGTFLDYIWR